MADVSLLDGARADFDAAFDWYATRSESAALHFAAAVADAVQRVSREAIPLPRDSVGPG